MNKTRLVLLLVLGLALEQVAGEKHQPNEKLKSILRRLLVENQDSTGSHQHQLQPPHHYQMLERQPAMVLKWLEPTIQALRQQEAQPTSVSEIESAINFMQSNSAASSADSDAFLQQLSGQKNIRTIGLRLPPRFGKRANPD